MFEAGRNEDARAIFDPDLLVQLMKHKVCNHIVFISSKSLLRHVFELLQTKLEIYLSPFLHGMRYTSFGRHFTKLKKLEEVNYLSLALSICFLNLCFSFDLLKSTGIEILI